jgi:hypothetical protein
MTLSMREKKEKTATDLCFRLMTTFAVYFQRVEKTNTYLKKFYSLVGECSSFLLVLFEKSASTVSNLIKIYELCDTGAFLHASYPSYN